MIIFWRFFFLSLWHLWLELLLCDGQCFLKIESPANIITTKQICQCFEVSSWWCCGILCRVSKSEMVVSAQLQYQSCPNKWPDDIDVRACHIVILSWTSCQRRLFPEVQRLLPRFFKLTNLKCSYTIFNGIVYLKYVILGKSHRLGIVYAPCVVIWHSWVFFVCDHDSTLTWSRDQQAARLLWRTDSAADSAGHSYLSQYCPPGSVLIWTLKLNSYKITQHWLMLLSVSDPLGSCFHCQSFQCESSMIQNHLQCMQWIIC